MKSGGGILFDVTNGIVGALVAGFLFGDASIINAPLPRFDPLRAARRPTVRSAQALLQQL